MFTRTRKVRVLSASYPDGLDMLRDSFSPFITATLGAPPSPSSTPPSASISRSVGWSAEVDRTSIEPQVHLRHRTHLTNRSRSVLVRGGLTVTGESMRPSLPEMELLRVSVGVPGQCGRKETGSQ